MELTIQAAHGSVHVRADDSGLSIDASGQRLETAWSDIAGAGLADPPGGRRGVTFDPEVVEVTPLLGRLQEAAHRLAATHRLLMIAHGPKRSLYQVSIPDDRPEVAELVGELSARLGPRWLGDAYEWGELKRTLAATTPRWYPLAGAALRRCRRPPDAPGDPRRRPGPRCHRGPRSVGDRAVDDPGTGDLGRGARRPALPGPSDLPLTPRHRSSVAEAYDRRMPADPPCNFRLIGPSRARLRAGDIFTMQIPDGRFLFGRVVRTLASSDRLALVYVFRSLSDAPIPPARLLVTELLIPPATINRLGWSRGYLSTVGNRPFEPGERLATHYFRGEGRVPSRGWLVRRLSRVSSQVVYEDEDGRPLGRPSSGVPVGEAGFGNYRTLDDAVSRALGIPLAPDDPG